jgi:hypothetical protein
VISTAGRRPLPAIPTPLVLAAGLAVVALATAAGLATGSPKLFLLGLGALALAGAAYLSIWAPPALFVSLAFVGTLVSGYTGLIGLPIGADRVLMAATVGSLVLGLPGVNRARQINWRPVHALALAAVAYAVINAQAAGTFLTSKGFFGLLDRLGVVPILVFVLAPLLFPDRRSRDLLLKVLVVIGAYLAVTAVAEQFHLDALVWPKYIINPGVGIHFDRVRGPFAEAVAMGLALYACAVAGAVAVVTWPAGWQRKSAGVVSAACLLCTVFTLTRAIWVATVVATLATLLLSPVTRRFLTPVLVAGVVGIGALLVLVPGLSDRSAERKADQGPVWERYATDAAAIRAAEAHPLFGIGWNRWLDVNENYLRQGATYPLTKTVGTIEVHNMFLAHLSELGIVGIALWGTALLAALAAAIIRPGPAELDPWRAGMVALALHWGIVGALGPLSYAFPNLLVWTWAGITGVGFLSSPRPADA